MALVASQQLKCVFVGDGGAGKTCVLAKRTQGSFPDDVEPTTSFDNLSLSAHYEDEPVTLALWDTAGQDGFERLRPVVYHGADVIVLAFALNRRESFVNVAAKWVPEVERHLPDVATILAGNKLDLRLDAERANDGEAGDAFVSASEGEALCKKLGCAAYVECSAITNENVAVLFNKAVAAAMETGDATREQSAQQQPGCTCVIA